MNLGHSFTVEVHFEIYTVLIDNFSIVTGHFVHDLFAFYITGIRHIF